MARVSKKRACMTKIVTQSVNLGGFTLIASANNLEDEMMNSKKVELLIFILLSNVAISDSENRVAEKLNDSSVSRSEADNKIRKSVENDAPVIRLESVFVGDKEQPSVSYFIPWKKIGTPDQLNWNIESSNDETLKIIDRSVVVRSLRLYDGLNLEGKD